MKRLKMLMSFIRTGLKYMGVSCVLVALHSCGFFEDDLKRLFSSAYIVNNSSDTVFVVSDMSSINYSHVSDLLIFPGDTFYYRGGNLVENADGDALDAILSDASLVRDGDHYLFVYTKESQAYIIEEVSSSSESPFCSDSLNLLKVWEPPLEEMGEEVHHFFNRSSWVVKPEETSGGGFSDTTFDVFFIITEDDFVQD